MLILNIFLTVKLSYLNMCFKGLFSFKCGVTMSAVENQGRGVWVSEVLSH